MAARESIGFHSEDVLIRTNDGEVEASLPASCSALSAELHEHLARVDDQAPFRSYARSLEDYGRLARLYNELRARGYVKLRSEVVDADGKTLLSRLLRLIERFPSMAG
jgi:hypothetical protein